MFSNMVRKKFAVLFSFFLAISLLTACVKTKSFDYYITPFSEYSTEQSPQPPVGDSTPTLSYRLQVVTLPGAMEYSPTPDAPHYQVSDSNQPGIYEVKPGDMLSAIALDFNIGMDTLANANNITNPNSLEVGQILNIPVVTPMAVGSSQKIIPDSELVYGPMSGNFDIEKFVNDKNSFLSSFTENVKGNLLTGAQVVDLVAKSESLSPRLLLAILDYCTGWVSEVNPGSVDVTSPFNVEDGFHTGLYLQLTWVGDYLNAGYYKWKSGDFTRFVLKDDSVIRIDPSLNAGSVAIQYFFAQRDGYTSWFQDVSHDGFYETYHQLFGNPFTLAIEPLIPENLLQPALSLPFEQGRLWAFTGGPHSSWDPGTPFGALDFAPADVQGCVQSDAWITAVANGLILRTGLGTVYQDLDMDGNEGTGWVILYMHVASDNKVVAGTVIKTGDRIGHPSCEGGVSNGSHLHIARIFNGEWIPADGSVPFTLDGWVAYPGSEEGDGTLSKGESTLIAFDGSLPINQIQR